MYGSFLSDSVLVCKISHIHSSKLIQKFKNPDIPSNSTIEKDKKHLVKFAKMTVGYIKHNMTSN